MTVSGGAGALMADAAEMAGLTVPPLPQPDQENLASLLHSFASPVNPIDVTGLFNPDNFEPVLAGLTESPGVDAVLPLIWTVGQREVDAVKKVHAMTDKPVAAAVTLSAPELTAAGIPTYSDPVRAVRALGAVARYSRLLGVVDRAEAPPPGPAGRPASGTCWPGTPGTPSCWNPWPSRCWPGTASRSAGRRPWTRPMPRRRRPPRPAAR